jgi:integrase
MRGSVRKRCQCRDAEGRRVRNCRKSHGSWFFVVDAGDDPVTHKRRQITRSGFRTRDEADEAMTKELAALDSGIWTDDQGLTLGAWLDQWLDEFGNRVESKGRSPKTLADYRSDVENVWRPQLGHVRLRDLRRAHISKALQEVSRRQTAGRKPGNSGSYVELRSGSTVDGYRRTLRAALAVARSRDLISVNPAEGRIDAIPDRTSADDEDDDLGVWEPDETARFLAHIAGDRLAAVYQLAAYAGLRRGELCGLRWVDLEEDWAGARVRQTIVDLSRGQARPGDLTCPTCGQEHVGRHFKRPKSRKGRRWVPLAQPARVALATHRAAQDVERAEFAEDYRDHGLVFCYIDGEPLRPDILTREFLKHAAECGLPPIRLHDLRHGACSLMLSGGVPIEIVQLILGHSSPAVTRKVYAHLMRRTSAQQVEAAVRAFTEQLREQSVSNDVESDGSAAPA